MQTQSSIQNTKQELNFKCRPFAYVNGRKFVCLFWSVMSLNWCIFFKRRPSHLSQRSINRLIILLISPLASHSPIVLISDTNLHACYRRSASSILMRIVFMRLMWFSALTKTNTQCINQKLFFVNVQVCVCVRARDATDDSGTEPFERHPKSWTKRMEKKQTISFMFQFNPCIMGAQLAFISISGWCERDSERCDAKQISFEYLMNTKRRKSTDHVKLFVSFLWSK